MKNIISKTLIAFLSLFLLSCEKTEDVIFDGDTALQFNFGTDGSKTVGTGDVSSEAIIEFGTLKVVSGTHQVKLVYDASKSTAAPGVDFTLDNSGVQTLSAGQSMGQFKVKILESGASAIPKVAVFHLSSDSLPLASFNQDYALTMSLKCPVSYFLGSTGAFNYTGWWNSSGQFLIEEGSAPNTLKVVDWMDTGVDLLVSYNDAGEAKIVDLLSSTTNNLVQGQDTGYPYQGGMNHYTIRQSSTLPSTYNACTRKLDLKAYWFVPNVGNFGEKSESFTGN